MARYLSLLTVVLAGTWMTLANARMCYLCGYNEPTDPVSAYSCVNNSRIHPVLNCSQERACTFDVQFMKNTMKVVSVTRSCLPTTYRSNGCKDDWTHKQCEYSCRSDLCNNVTADDLINHYVSVNSGSSLLGLTGVLITLSSYLFIT